MALGGSPWMVGKHALILQHYDECLRPSEIKFDRMDIWIRILNLPLGWMNRHRGERAMNLVGEVKKMDVDKDGKASGSYLRARVAIDVVKPLRRGVLLKTKKDASPEWFDIQYEKLPFFCMSCGIMGHSELECGNLSFAMIMGSCRMTSNCVLQRSRRKSFRAFWRQQLNLMVVVCRLDQNSLVAQLRVQMITDLGTQGKGPIVKRRKR